MTILEVRHWLHLEDNDMGFVNVDSGPPASTGLITTDPEEPACWEWDFASSDDVDIQPSFPFERATALDSVGFDLRIKVTNIGNFDAFDWSIRSDEASGGSRYATVRLSSDGSLRIGGTSNYVNSSLTVWGSLPAGTIQDGVWHTWSVRWISDNTVGEAQLSVDGGAPVSFVGDTDVAGSGTTATAWGPAVWMSTSSGLTGNVRIAHMTFWQDEAAVLRPQRYEWLAPDGVTADIDAVIGGSTPAATRHESVDETPVDAGVTLLTMPVGKQGFTFANRTGTGTQRSAQLWGNLADPAAGAPTLNSFLSDGTETDSPTLAIPSTFYPRVLGPIIEAAPSGGALDVDVLTGGLERTA